MSRARIFATLTIISLGAAFGLAPQQSHAQQPYFAGKTLTLYVGRTPGSGGDLAARMFAGHWQKQIPGEPTIVVRNMPGGGGTRVFNWAAEVAEADGTHVVFSPTAGIRASA